MARELSVFMANLPDVFGPGATFAYSGLDGPTSAASGFSASFIDRYSLLFHTPTRRIFGIRLATIDNPLLATGDVLVAETQTEELFLSWSHWHTLVGLAPAGSHLRLLLEDGAIAVVDGSYHISLDPDGRDAVVLAIAPGQFALSYGKTAQEARERALASLSANLDEIVQERMAVYGEMPSLSDAGRDRLLKKCISVVRASTMSPEGHFGQHWTTANRAASQDMRSWASIFHSLAYNVLDADVGWEILKSILDTQQADGLIPLSATAGGEHSPLACPPLLAWAVWENHRHRQDSKALEYAFARLEDHLDWLSANRDRNRNGLLEWHVSGEGNAHCPESGQADSPRFDEGLVMDSVDFSALAALDMKYVAKIAGILGDDSSAKYWAGKSWYASQQIHGLLWNASARFYFDRRMDGTLSSVPAAAGLLPLLLDDLPDGRLEDLVAMLSNPGVFATACPVPGVGVNLPDWSANSGRSAMRPWFNYLLILALRRRNRDMEAAWLRDRTIHHVQKYYERSGVVYACYDAMDRIAPNQLHGDGSAGAAAVGDDHTTAAVVVALLAEEFTDSARSATPPG